MEKQQQQQQTEEELVELPSAAQIRQVAAENPNEKLSVSVQLNLRNVVGLDKEDTIKMQKLVET